MVRATLVTVLVQMLVATAVFAQAPGLAQKGEQVYAAQKCAVCHSIAGKGNQKGPLDSVGSKLSADEIREWIVNAPGMATKTKATRKPVMRAYTNLPKDELDALVAYLQTLKGK